MACAGARPAGAQTTSGGSAGAGHGATASGPCKFFGSAKGCSNERCPFSHDAPNSVAPCSFKQRGQCDRGDACTFRHIPWASAEQARAHYRSRDSGAVELSKKRYLELHRDGGEASGPPKVAREHVEGIVAREMHVEAYGSTAVRMMEKMGYKTGAGLGKESQGATKLAGPCVALERASQSCVLGLGEYTGNARATAAERAARLAEARAKKQRRVEETAFVQHNLLSSDESSDGEDRLVKSRDIMLSTT
mmetsp:Transcript_12773/g.36260  ORF Transcript_12773/g.36260 Transcript_12773/m.36260 type:complete len:249 (+) Transcript_12773:88-834(+)